MNDFFSNVTKTFSKLRKEEDFYDVTLVTDDQKQMSAHKVVLSSCSEYFKHILKQNNHSHPLICLEGIKSNELTNILDYAYNGEVNIQQDDLERFLFVAHRFKLEGLISEEINSFNTEDTYLDTDIEVSSDNKAEEIAANQMVMKSTRNETMIQKFEIMNSEQNLGDLDAKIQEILRKDFDGKWICTFCGIKSQMKSHIKEHIEVHFNGIRLRCQECDYICGTRKALRCHKNRHRKNSIKQEI